MDESPQSRLPGARVRRAPSGRAGRASATLAATVSPPRDLRRRRRARRARRRAGTRRVGCESSCDRHRSPNRQRRNRPRGSPNSSSPSGPRLASSPTVSKRRCSSRTRSAIARTTVTPAGGRAQPRRRGRGSGAARPLEEARGTGRVEFLRLSGSESYLCRRRHDFADLMRRAATPMESPSANRFAKLGKE